jgi:hypothetical protein
MAEPHASTSPSAALPVLEVPMSAEAILERLGTMSRRGRLDGFEANPSQPRPGLFAASALGTPFDSVLIARASHPGDTRPDAAHMTTLAFEIVMLHKMPMVFAAILLVTVWPGVVLTDMFIADWFPSLWRLGITWYWYLPLTILSIPFAWRVAMRRSRESARQYAMETIDSIAKELGGTMRTA